MRAVIQRVSSASVTVDGEVTGRVDRGICVLLGIHQADGEADLEWMTAKVAQLRIFEDSAGKMNLSIQETGGSALVISQFTLCGDCRKGRRPSFIEAARPEQAIPLYEGFCKRLSLEGIPVAKGVFGARMEVSIVNDGPVTLILDSPARAEG
jgi:D-tyrosyl-tRNA(Tyr) deacylase